ncbi:hypothetical protein [Ohtaekwangia koreensis]|uniref:Phage gp6-like head-tail connector protein n=1 Tax=Ohtaekwangia koreensis TaxID=688867 RepID=A0A1T5JQ92_9BACT|nr:hypothetical protein [Ohtaekwangia koreensis]SKC53535.1 hypothetical protein SAMN05660236_1353 [Ohtaekwangia koreensis]
MYISKTKTYSNLISLTEVKQDLKIHESDDSSNAELQRLIKVALTEAEKFTSIDIVPTVNTLEDYCIYGCWYELPEPSINIIGISAFTESNIMTVLTGYSLYKFNNFTHLKFNNSLNAHKLMIEYSAGYSTLPDDIKHAIKLKIGEYFDVEKNGYIPTNLQKSKSFERLLSPYILIA